MIFAILEYFESVSSWLAPWTWSWWFLALWIVVNCSPMWMAIRRNKRSGWNEERDRKYEPFARIDYKYWSYSLSLVSHFLFWPRFVIGWGFFFFGCLGSAFWCIGADPFNLPKWRIEAVRYTCFISSYCALPLQGYLPFKKRVDYDYSKYLGKDWKKTYDGAGIFVQNHQTPQDVMMSWMVQRPQPGALGKRESLKVPLTKYLVGPLEFMLVGRDKKDSAEVRARLLEDIKTRQIKAENGEMPPLLIYPEGATTNGSHIIKFKKGAFMSLRKIKPHVSTFKALTNVRPVHGDAIDIFTYCIVLAEIMFAVYIIQELPVFEPNEYFWKNHWRQGKEEKWEAYARVIRDIMCDAGGLQVSDLSLEDKIDYKHIVRGTKKDT
jgi:1-acyl-sn-glycerol-3-phosphate acyltransferase